MSVSVRGTAAEPSQDQARELGGPAARAWRALGQLPASLTAGAIIILLVLGVAVGADWLAPYPYDMMHYGDIQSPPSRQFVLGTDQYGRDVLSRILVGSRISLCYGLGSTALSLQPQQAPDHVLDARARRDEAGQQEQRGLGDGRDRARIHQGDQHQADRAQL